MKFVGDKRSYSYIPDTLKEYIIKQFENIYSKQYGPKWNKKYNELVKETVARIRAGGCKGCGSHASLCKCKQWAYDMEHKDDYEH